MDMEARVRHLEEELIRWRRQLRRWQRLFVAMALLLLVGLAWTLIAPAHAQKQPAPAPGPVHTTNLVLVDETGTKHAEFATSKRGPMITFYGAGKPRLILGMKDLEPGMIFLSEANKTSLQMYTSPSHTSLSLFDFKGSERILLSSKGAVTSLRLNDNQTKSAFDVTVTGDNAKLSLTDGQGKKSWTAPDGRP